MATAAPANARRKGRMYIFWSAIIVGFVVFPLLLYWYFGRPWMLLCVVAVMGLGILTTALEAPVAESRIKQASLIALFGFGLVAVLGQFPQPSDKERLDEFAASVLDGLKREISVIPTAERDLYDEKLVNPARLEVTRAEDFLIIELYTRPTGDSSSIVSVETRISAERLADAAMIPAMDLKVDDGRRLGHPLCFIGTAFAFNAEEPIRTVKLANGDVYHTVYDFSTAAGPIANRMVATQARDAKAVAFYRCAWVSYYENAQDEWISRPLVLIVHAPDLQAFDGQMGRKIGAELVKLEVFCAAIMRGRSYRPDCHFQWKTNVAHRLFNETFGGIDSVPTDGGK